jgi:hypothetical protein
MNEMRFSKVKLLASKQKVVVTYPNATYGSNREGLSKIKKDLSDRGRPHCRDSKTISLNYNSYQLRLCLFLYYSRDVLSCDAGNSESRASNYRQSPFYRVP